MSRTYRDEYGRPEPPPECAGEWTDGDPGATVPLTPEEMQELYEAALREMPPAPPPTEAELDDMHLRFLQREAPF